MGEEKVCWRFGGVQGILETPKSLVSLGIALGWV